MWSAADEVVEEVFNHVKDGGQIVMAFKTGFTNQYSTVRAVTAPGPLRAAAGFHYQEFTNLAEQERLTPDPYGGGEKNNGAVRQGFTVRAPAKLAALFEDP